VTGFAVDESALEVFAGRLELLALGVPTARGYLGKHVDVSFGDTGVATYGSMIDKMLSIVAARASTRLREWW